MIKRLLILLGIFWGSLPVHAQSDYRVIYVNDAGEVIALNPRTNESDVLISFENPLQQAYGLHTAGEYLAIYLRTENFDPNLPFSYHLYVLKGQTVILDQNLLPPNYTYPPEQQLGDPSYELTRALGEVLWSPDKTQLAFISAHEGNADVYIFEVNTQALTRYATPQTAAFLSWNPSGNRLIWADLLSFGDGSGYQVAGYMTNGENLPLGTKALAWVGWQDENQILYAPLDFTLFGASGLEIYDFATNTSQSLLPPQIALTIPVWDAASETLAFVVPNFVDGGLVFGAYEWQLSQAQPTLLQSGTFYSVEWVRPNHFQFESPQGSFLFTTGALRPLPQHDFGLFLSPHFDLAVLARAEGVYISQLTTDDATLVWADQTQVPIWSPDGAYFYTFSFLPEGAGLVEVDIQTRTARLLDSRMAVTSPRVILTP